MQLKQKILEFLCILPQDRVVTYKFLAEKFNTGPRAVARILASNTEQETYPCYKVVRSDGLISGYNLGIEEKIHRLQKDGILIRNNKIDSQYFYQD